MKSLFETIQENVKLKIVFRISNYWLNHLSAEQSESLHRMLKQTGYTTSLDEPSRTVFFIPPEEPKGSER
jgi:hypothetical protein